MAAQTLIGTFGPTSRYPGQRVTYLDGQFTIEGSGPVSPVALEAWATAGQLEWVSPEMGAWVHDRTRPGAIPPVADAGVESGGAPAVPPPPAGGKATEPRKHRALTIAGLALLILVVIGGAFVLGQRNHHKSSAAKPIDPRCFGVYGRLPSTTTDTKVIVNKLLAVADNQKAPASWGCPDSAWTDQVPAGDPARQELLHAWAMASEMTATGPAYDGQAVRFRAIALNPEVGWRTPIGYFDVTLVGYKGGDWRLGPIDKVSPSPDTSTTVAPSPASSTTLAPTPPPTNPVSQRAEIVAKTLSMPGALGGSFTTVSFQVESGGQVIAGGDQTFTVDEDLSGGQLAQTSDRVAYVQGLVQQLESQGWTDVGTGSQWYNHQFTK